MEKAKPILGSKVERRTLHPVDEAELVFVENGKIARISK